MFKLIKKLIAGVVLLVLGAAGYYYLRQADNRRWLMQTYVEAREQLQTGEKKYAWTGSVVILEIVKGDTLVVRTEQHPRVTVRLAGVDAPEYSVQPRGKDQPLAEDSKKFTSQLALNQSGTMAIVTTDHLKRPVVVLWLGETMVNARLVEEGLAEYYEEFATDLPAKIRHALINAQIRAQEKRRGIWGLENYQRPSDFRLRKS